MVRLFAACACSYLVVLAFQPGGQDGEQKQALALEKTVQKVIEDNDASIACVLVSRSDLYGRFGQGPHADYPGKLGAFDGETLYKNTLFTELSPAERQKLLKKLDLAESTSAAQSSGSGLVVDGSGLVLTPYHVVHGAAKIYVTLAGGKGAYADIYAADPRSDLAVLRLLGPKMQLRAVKFGDGGKVERGQFVIGMARPQTSDIRIVKASASWGIIANLGQRLPSGEQSEARLKTIHQYGTLLLTDARVNLGTSGGVLLNLKGEAVALTTTLAGITGPDASGSLAIPLDPPLQHIIEILKKGEEVEYGFLGVSLKPSGKKKTVVLESVTKGSPADQAGLEENHIILAVEGRPVYDNDELLRALAMQMAGAKVRLEVGKTGSTNLTKVEVVLAKLLVSGKLIATSPGTRPYFRGLRVDHTSLLVQQPGTAASEIPRGVLIGDVQPDSAAAKADLKPGAVITHVNDRAVATPAAFYEVVVNHKGPVQLTLQAPDIGQPAPKVTLP
ncbi:MAG TPA: trypsin-like peptidase domain-containing protein [Gemmataceae bacterium]|nr:trypsin-like peptidase domain-containing protein [Gemmataceae bacterium]